MFAELSIVTYWRGLSSGDPAAWIITVVVGGTLLGLLFWSWRKNEPPPAGPME